MIKVSYPGGIYNCKRCRNRYYLYNNEGIVLYKVYVLRRHVIKIYILQVKITVRVVSALYTRLVSLHVFTTC